MSNSSLDFDDVAADDALIESLRAGASVDELPSDDAAAALLVSLRDGASAEDENEMRTEVAVPARAVVSGVISHRRSIAVTAIVGVLTTAGVGTAVAGDPTAAFSYLFRQGVEFGSRLGTPDSEVGMGAKPGADGPHASTAISSAPVRKGSAAAPLSDDGQTREPVGFERGSLHWTVPAPRDLESVSDDDGGSVGRADGPDGVGGFGDTKVTDDATKADPFDSQNPGPDAELTSPPDDGDVDTDSDGGSSTEDGSDIDTDSQEPTEPPTDDSETTLTETPTESPTESPSESPTESPTESTTESPPESPTESPSQTPSQTPSESPSQSPSESTSAPPETTAAPSETPSGSPSSPTGTSSTR